MLWEHAGQINWGHRCLGAYWGLFIFMVESVDICSSRRIGNAPELRQLVSYEAHASFRLDPIGSVDYYASNKSL